MRDRNRGPSMVHRDLSLDGHIADGPPPPRHAMLEHEPLDGVARVVDHRDHHVGVGAAPLDRGGVAYVDQAEVTCALGPAARPDHIHARPSQCRYTQATERALGAEDHDLWLTGIHDR